MQLAQQVTVMLSVEARYLQHAIAFAVEAVTSLAVAHVQLFAGRGIAAIAHAGLGTSWQRSDVARQVCDIVSFGQLVAGNHLFHADVPAISVTVVHQLLGNNALVLLRNDRHVAGGYSVAIASMAGNARCVQPGAAPGIRIKTQNFLQLFGRSRCLLGRARQCDHRYQQAKEGPHARLILVLGRTAYKGWQVGVVPDPFAFPVKPVWADPGTHLLRTNDDSGGAGSCYTAQV